MKTSVHKRQDQRMKMQAAKWEEIFATHLPETYSYPDKNFKN